MHAHFSVKSWRILTTFWKQDFYPQCFSIATLSSVLVLNTSPTSRVNRRAWLGSCLLFVRSSSLIRGAIWTLRAQQERQGGWGRWGGGRYDTLPGRKPRHPAPVTNERGMKEKCTMVVAGGSRAAQAVCVLQVCGCVRHWGSPAVNMHVDVHTCDVCVCLWFGLFWLIYYSPWCPRMRVPHLCVALLFVSPLTNCSDCDQNVHLNPKPH